MGVHDGHRKRLKEEFLMRPDSFPDHKVLEVLLFYANPRSDTNLIAHALLERFGSLSGVLDARAEELEKVPGVKTHAVVLLRAVKELGGRYLVGRASVEDLVISTGVAGRMLAPYFFGARNEMICVLCMDGKGKKLGIRKVGEGNVNAVEIATRLIVEAALSLNAAQLILAHNHVSGLAFPSPEDRVTTLRLQVVLGNVGVVLADHLIFVDDDMVSLRDSGFLTVEK